MSTLIIPHKERECKEFPEFSGKYLPLKLIDSRDHDMHIMVHRDLVEAVNQVTGKHREPILYELALCWRRYLRDGEFGVSTKLLDHLHNAKVRLKIVSILNNLTETVANHCTHQFSSRCKSRRFTLSGVTEKGTTYNSTPGQSPGLTCPSHLLTPIVIPAEWLHSRHIRWTEYCDENNLTQNLDIDGRTEWGAATFKTLDATELPAEPPADASDETVKHHRALTRTGVLRCVKRKHGRCYHPLSNLNKTIRRMSRIDSQGVKEVDVHACYSALLTAQLPASEGKARTIQELQTGWYDQFAGAYESHMERLAANGKAYRQDGKWMMRVDDDPAHDEPACVKVEFQRQCLFWQDSRLKSRPLWAVLRKRHPELARLIGRYRSRMDGSRLSHVIQQAEGRMMIDDLLPALHRRGILALSNHDGMIVPSQYASVAAEIMELICHKHLGFVPRVAIK